LEGLGVLGGFEIAISALKIERPIESAKSAPVDFRELRDLLKNIFEGASREVICPKGKGLTCELLENNPCVANLQHLFA